ncbi:hypothetical protein GGTG_02413 [Gaeumannomyces tritici R3-111a-1]|uniref:SET domain-containing protein n=1 Tax=Gaeumannomyces tritici (strain R3-111a-1) TaxID=644352 RepID=J3NMA9_GAET3|nr:hypothetical protein GGTG_02413 [Gaeumannomyces tritici R3-111a-1]EJT82440.1 hypothetical protein GGTG_02413 [Gaeumannomyces tritici R3-111a-1]
MATPAGNDPPEGDATTNDGPGSANRNPLFEIKDVPGMGKGMIARVDIARGTTIHTEKPLVVGPSRGGKNVANSLGYIEMVFSVNSGDDSPSIDIIKALPKDKQRQFFSLSDSSHSHGSGKIRGIWVTNSLPVMIPDPSNFSLPREAVALTMSRVNHSCQPNSLLRYDEGWYQLKALRPIRAGEQVTITYKDYIHQTTSQWRRRGLEERYVECKCEVCLRVAAGDVISDVRRDLIAIVTEAAQFGCPLSFYDPQLRLTRCRMLICLLNAEFPAGEAAEQVLQAYKDALDIAIAHGDCARASVFARRMLGLIPLVGDAASGPGANGFWEMVADQPRRHPSWRECSSRWDTTLRAIPQNLSEGDFENWLWRQRF